MIKVSVIVPVYNVEKYIDKCLKSLVTQTLKGIEILVINDGSPDNSQDIIDKYKKKHPRLIKSYIKKNGGLSDARNFGIKKASGKYIAFLDSDDSFRKDALELLYNKAVSEKFDVTVCDVKQVYESGETGIIVSSNFERDLHTKEEVKEALVNLYPSAWNKLYKRELLTKKYYFKKDVYFEDVEFAYRFFTQVTSIGVVREPLIYYLKREGAITAVFDKRLYHYIDNWNSIIDFYKTNKLYDEYKEVLEYCYVRYIYATFIKACTNYDMFSYKEAVDVAIRNVHNTFPDYKENKYLSKSLKGQYLKRFNKFTSLFIYLLWRKK